MTAEKIREVILLYKKTLSEAGIKKHDFSNDTKNPTPLSSLENCRDMLDQMDSFLDKGTPLLLEKTFRWLGFIQGILWVNGYYTIIELKKHNG